MTFPFPIPQTDPVPEQAGPTSAASDQAGAEAARLTVPPQVGSRPAGFGAAPNAAADPRIPVAVPRPDAGDAASRIDPAAGAADASSRPVGVLWRAAALGIAACLGAAAGSAGSAALFGPASRTQADPPDDLHTLKESVAQLRGHVKVVNDNMTALRANFGTVTSALTAQLTKISDEVEKVERLQSDRRTGTSGAENLAPAPGEAKPSKPAVVEGWVLRSVSDGVALIEGRHGVIEIEPGDSLPGIGRIHEIKRQDGHWVVVTPKGLIVSAR